MKRIRKEGEILLRLLKAALGTAEAIPYPRECEGEMLIKLIDHHRLKALLYPVISSQQDEGWKPVAESLKKDFHRSVKRSLTQEYEIGKLLDEMEKAGIDCIPLKGWILRNLYPDPVLRSMADFDVLVKDYDSGVMQGWMEAQGYTADQVGAGHHDNFLKKPYMNIEVHRRLTIETEGPVYQWTEDIWKRCVPAEGKKHIFAMTDEDFYIYHLIHMHKHFTQCGTGVRSVADIYIYLREMGEKLDRQYLDRELEKLGMRAFAERMEKLSRIWFEGEEMDRDSELITTYLLGSGIYGNMKNYKAIGILDENASSYRSGKFQTKWKIAFPGVDVVKVRYPVVGKYPVLLPVFWIVRVLRVLLLDRKKAKALNFFDEVSESQYDYVQDVFRAAGINKMKQNGL